MWELINKNGNDVSFIEGEYGLALPITLTGVDIGPSDSVLITIKTGKNGNVILEKEYTDIQNGQVDLVLSESESAKFAPGNYVYNLDWYLDGIFNGTVINGAKIRVVDKA